MGKKLTLCTTIGLLMAPFTWPVLAVDETKPTKVEQKATALAGVDQHDSTGINALENAAKLGKYAFVFFYRNENARTDQLRTVFDGALAKISDRAESVVIQVNDLSKQKIINRFKVYTAPMPFILVIAPNGAVIHSYQQPISENQLMDSFASSGMEKTLKSLQDGKMTFLCIQNNSTKFNIEAMKGVNELKSDPKYAETTSIVTIDPSEDAEALFLNNISVDTKTTQAVTVLLAPPGNIVDTFKGATDKKVLLASIQNITKKKPCCPDKKGGCKPKTQGN